MEKEIIELKKLFDSIICLAVEGPEVTTKLQLMEVIRKEAMIGYNLCKNLKPNILGQLDICKNCAAKKLFDESLTKNRDNIFKD